MKDKRVAGGLKLDLAQFRELEAFAQLGTELDKATQTQLDRGYRMVEILKQPQFKPMNVIDQIMIIYAGNTGLWTRWTASKVRAWEEQFLSFMHEQTAGGADAACEGEGNDSTRWSSSWTRRSRSSSRSSRHELSVISHQ